MITKNSGLVSPHHSNSFIQNSLKLKEISSSFRERGIVKNLKYIEDITCPLVDMNFIFEWPTQYLTSERSI